MRFRVGQRVRASARTHEGHHRTPSYVKGKSGIVVRTHAAFRNPETRAYGADGLPEQQVYQIGFAQKEMWPRDPRREDGRIYVDVFEHWLEEDA